MKALMQASREQPSAQRKRQVKELPKSDSRPHWKYLDLYQKSEWQPSGATGTKIPMIFQWYQILRQHYQFSLFQAVRVALWLVR